MKTILFKPSYLCNNDCIFCKAGGIKINLTLGEIKKRIDTISNSGNFERIILSGGEATIRNDFFMIADYILSKDLKYGVATNLRQFSKTNFFNNSIKLKPDIIFGSFYSARNSPKISL